MDDDDFRVTSVLYRLMPPRKRARSDIGEALDATGVTGPELREALDAARGTAELADSAGDLSWPDVRPPWHQRGPWRAIRPLCRVDVGILIVAIITAFLTWLILAKTH